jgi:rhodanese-related sulfurtransferase
MRYSRYSLSLFTLALCIILSACWRSEKKEGAESVGKLLVVNVLEPADFDDAHIKGSINVPLENLESAAAGWPKNTRVVVYCVNYMCTSSLDGVRKLGQLGFKDAVAYEGGIAEWKQKGFPVEGPATKGYLANVGQKTQTPSDVKIIEAEALKDEIEKAQKAGLLHEK